MEKKVEVSMLCQIYGKLLTDKQYEFIDDYYNNDLSLSEIAENNNMSDNDIDKIKEYTDFIKVSICDNLIVKLKDIFEYV